jgi:hypothetical protein
MDLEKKVIRRVLEQQIVIQQVVLLRRYRLAAALVMQVVVNLGCPKRFKALQMGLIRVYCPEQRLIPYRKI